MNLPIDKAPEFGPFAARYADDIVAFAEEVLRLDLTPSQAEILRGAAVPGARIGLTTHAESQDYLLPPLALHRLFFRAPAVTSVAYPRAALAVGDPYRVLALAASAGHHAWIRPFLKITGASISVRHSAGCSSVQFVPIRTGRREEFAPEGAEHMWFIPDAGSLPVGAFQRIAPCLVFRTQGVICCSPANSEFRNDRPISLPLEQWFFCWPPRGNQTNA